MIYNRYIIITGTDKSVWYQGQTNKFFPVIEEFEDGYYTIDLEGYKNIVYKSDCELVQVVPHKWPIANNSWREDIIK